MIDYYHIVNTFTSPTNDIHYTQLYTVNLNNPDDCSKTFRSNRNLGIILWISILLSSAVKYNDRRKQKEVENVEGKHVELSS